MATRREFTRIAEGVRYVVQDPTADKATCIKMVSELASALGTFNSSFNRAKFIEACGLSGKMI